MEVSFIRNARDASQLKLREPGLPRVKTKGRQTDILQSNGFFVKPRVIISMESEDLVQLLEAYQEITKTNIGKLKGVIKLARRALDSKNIHHFLDLEKWSPLQALAIALTIPIDISCREVYIFLCTCLRGAHEAGVDAEFRRKIAMRVVRCATFAREIGTLYQNGLIQGLCQSDPTTYQTPLLYLCVQAGKPIDYQKPVPTGDTRHDALMFYYMGLNRLFLHNFPGADECMSCAWMLGSHEEDLRASIMDGMSLTAFLVGKSLEVFRARLKRKEWPTSGPAFDIWVTLPREKPLQLRGLYQLFFSDIMHMKRVHMIRAAARTMKCVKLSDLATLGAVKESDLSETLKEMIDNGQIKANVRDGVVSDMKLVLPIDAEMAKVTELAAMSAK